jgi:hypothetical protein
MKNRDHAARRFVVISGGNTITYDMRQDGSMVCLKPATGKFIRMEIFQGQDGAAIFLIISIIKYLHRYQL